MNTLWKDQSVTGALIHHSHGLKTVWSEHAREKPQICAAFQLLHISWQAAHSKKKKQKSVCPAWFCPQDPPGWIHPCRLLRPAGMLLKGREHIKNIPLLPSVFPKDFRAIGGFGTTLQICAAPLVLVCRQEEQEEMLSELFLPPAVTLLSASVATKRLSPVCHRSGGTRGERRWRPNDRPRLSGALSECTS